MNSITFNYSGWVLFCPVIIDDMNSECPTVSVRWEFMEYVLDFAYAVEAALIGLGTLVNPDWEPQFMIYSVDELKQPIVKGYYE